GQKRRRLPHAAGTSHDRVDAEDVGDFEVTTTSAELETRLGVFVEHHVLKSEQLDPADLCTDRPELVEPLRALIKRYLSLTISLDSSDDPVLPGMNAASLPSFDGFQTIERIAGGGMGEVFKLRDLKLDRVVAAKVVRGGQARWKTATEGFLR